jgi:hypothetical protein
VFVAAYTRDVRSRTASEVARRRTERLAGLTPAERVAIAEQLTEEGLRTYMATHHVDRATALARIKATRRLGRRPSASASADER